MAGKRLKISYDKEGDYLAMSALHGVPLEVAS
jgi:hypothetical protein